jgi:hypothetical protein
MMKKQSTSKDPAPQGHILHDKLTPREVRVLGGLEQDEKTDQTPSKE